MLLDSHQGAIFQSCKITEMCYLPQVGTQCDVLSRRNHALLVPCNEMPCLMAGGAVPRMGELSYNKATQWAGQRYRAPT